jgi:hypothetical protein
MASQIRPKIDGFDTKQGAPSVMSPSSYVRPVESTRSNQKKYDQQQNYFPATSQVRGPLAN